MCFVNVFIKFPQLPIPKLECSKFLAYLAIVMLNYETANYRPTEFNLLLIYLIWILKDKAEVLSINKNFSLKHFLLQSEV